MFQCRLGQGTEQRIALPHYHGSKQFLFVTEIAVKGGLRHRGSLGDGLHAGATVAMRQKDPPGSIKYGLTFCIAMGSHQCRRKIASILA